MRLETCNETAFRFCIIYLMAKKYRVKLRFKRKKEIYKKTFFILLALALLPFLPYVCSRSYAYLKNFYSGFGSRNINSIRVDFSEKFISQPLTELLRRKIGTEFGGKTGKEIEDYVNSRWPYVSGVKVEFSGFTGALTVSGRFEKAIALYLSDEGKKYILESGKAVGGINMGENFLVVRSQARLSSFPPGFVAFINEFNGLKSRFNFGVSEIIYDGEGDTYLLLEDRSRIMWGSFRFTREKIGKLNEILGDALKKLQPPFRVDARYFEEGKVLVSVLEDGAG